MNDENSLFNKFKTVYQEYQLDIKNGEQVIFVAFKNKEGNNLSGNMFSSGKDFLEKYKIVFSSNSKFEYFQAYKFNNRYYLINEDKSIDKKASFSLNKNQDLSLNYLIMEYTDKDWTMCQDINKKIIELKNKVDNLFSNKHNVGLLDKPLSESANPLLLEVLSTFKKPKI
ncbi:hypothetical protein GW796_08035 [archaeon]|nr:hypothetical protein [archaeon]